MNPHTLFMGLAMLSLGVTALEMYISGNYAGLYELGVIMGIAIACISVILILTRKYWRNARRLA